MGHADRGCRICHTCRGQMFSKSLISPISSRRAWPTPPEIWRSLCLSPFVFLSVHSMCSYVLFPGVFEKAQTLYCRHGPENSPNNFSLTWSSTHTLWIALGSPHSFLFFPFLLFSLEFWVHKFFVGASLVDLSNNKKIYIFQSITKTFKTYKAFMNSSIQPTNHFVFTKV